MLCVCVCGSPTFRYALAHHKPEPITTLPPGKTKKRPSGKGWRRLLSFATVWTETDVRLDWKQQHTVEQPAETKHCCWSVSVKQSALTHTQTHKHAHTAKKLSEDIFCAESFFQLVSKLYCTMLIGSVLVWCEWRAPPRVRHAGLFIASNRHSLTPRDFCDEAQQTSWGQSVQQTTRIQLKA